MTDLEILAILRNLEKRFWDLGKFVAIFMREVALVAGNVDHSAEDYKQGFDGSRQPGLLGRQDFEFGRGGFVRVIHVFRKFNVPL